MLRHQEEVSASNSNRRRPKKVVKTTAEYLKRGGEERWGCSLQSKRRFFLVIYSSAYSPSSSNTSGLWHISCSCLAILAAERHTRQTRSLTSRLPFLPTSLRCFFFFLSVLFFFTTFFIPLSLICSFCGPASRQVRGGSTFYTLRFFFVSLLLSSSDSSTNPSTGVTQTFTLFLLSFSRHCCAKRKTSTSRLVFIDFARHLHNFVQTVSQIYVK